MYVLRTPARDFGFMHQQQAFDSTVAVPAQV